MSAASRAAQNCSSVRATSNQLRGPHSSEVQSEIQPDEARIVDARRRRPPCRTRRVIQVVDVVRVEPGRIVRIEQVVHIDADVRARTAEPHYFRKSHVDLVATLSGVDAMLVVGELDDGVAG